MTIFKGAPDGQSQETYKGSGKPRPPDPISEHGGGRAPNGEEYD